MSVKHLDLKDSAIERSVVLLVPLLAGATDLMLSAKEAHWNVKGPNFIALHGHFDALHASAAIWADELAERLVQLGAHAHGRLGAIAEKSPLPAYPMGLSRAEAHLLALCAQTGALGELTRQAIDAAVKGGDAGTADLFTEISRALDKQLWLLEAHLD